MKKRYLLFFVFLSCTSPEDRHYDEDTWWADVAEMSNTPKLDSINHRLCVEAVVDNEIRGVKNEQFTYKELIKQGTKLYAKKRAQAMLDSLNIE